jgi:hypothetical protein
MRSVECPDAAAGVSPRVEEVRVSGPRPAADSGRVVLLVSGQAPADSDQALVFAPLVRLRERGSQHLLLQTVPLLPAHLHPDGTSLSALTAHSDSGAFIIGSFSMTASDASRRSSPRSSSEAGYFWDRRSFLLSLATMATITGLRRHHRNQLS